MAKSRISQKTLKIWADMVNDETDHNVHLCFTQGCGVTVTIDGVTYNHERRDGSIEGISNKEAYEMISKLYLKR